MNHGDVAVGVPAVSRTEASTFPSKEKRFKIYMKYEGVCQTLASSCAQYSGGLPFDLSWDRPALRAHHSTAAAPASGRKGPPAWIKSRLPKHGGYEAAAPGNVLLKKVLYGDPPTTLPVAFSRGHVAGWPVGRNQEDVCELLQSSPRNAARISESSLPENWPCVCQILLWKISWGFALCADA